MFHVCIKENNGLGARRLPLPIYIKLAKLLYLSGFNFPIYKMSWTVPIPTLAVAYKLLFPHFLKSSWLHLTDKIHRKYDSKSQHVLSTH